MYSKKLIVRNNIFNLFFWCCVDEFPLGFRLQLCVWSLLPMNLHLLHCHVHLFLFGITLACRTGAAGCTDAKHFTLLYYGLWANALNNNQASLWFLLLLCTINSSKMRSGGKNIIMSSCIYSGNIKRPLKNGSVMPHVDSAEATHTHTDDDEQNIISVTAVPVGFRFSTHPTASSAPNRSLRSTDSWWCYDLSITADISPDVVGQIKVH